jgi:hypothetical protein
MQFAMANNKQLPIEIRLIAHSPPHGVITEGRTRSLLANVWDVEIVGRIQSMQAIDELKRLGFMEVRGLLVKRGCTAPSEQEFMRKAEEILKKHGVLLK